MAEDKVVKITFEVDSNADTETAKIDSQLRFVSKVAVDASKELNALANATVNVDRDISKVIATVSNEEKKVADAAAKTGEAVKKTETQIRELADASSQVGKTIDAAFDNSAQSVDQLTGKLQTLKNQQSELKQIISDASKWGPVNKALTDEFDKLSAEITEAEQRIAGYGKTVGDAKEKHVGLRTELQNMREQLVLMEKAGLRGTEAYKQLQIRAGELTDAMADARAQANILAHDQAALQGVISGLGGIAGAASAAQGAMSLFAGENENLQKIMLKVQSLMAITVGLQQVQQTLDKDSAFRVKTLGDLKNWWAGIVAKAAGAETAEAAALRAQAAAATQGVGANAANAAATTAQAGAATAGTAANLGLAGSFRAVGLAIKSIPVWGWIAAAVGVIVSVVAKLASETEKVDEKTEELHKKTGEAAGKQIQTVEMLSASWNRLGDNLKEKERFINRNKKAFDELGVSVKNVMDAENLLVTNKTAFISAQIEKAKATAALSLSEDLYKDITKKKLELSEVRKNQPLTDVYTTQYNGQFGNTSTKVGSQENPLIKRMEDEIKALQETAKEYIEMATDSADEYNRINTKANIAMSQDSEKEKKDKKVDKDIDDLLRAQSDYEHRLKAMQFDFEQQQINALNDSFYKQRKQIELNHTIDLADAQAQGAELLAAKKRVYGDHATLTDAERAIIANSVKAADDVYQAEIERLNEDVNLAFRDGRLRFADELTVQLADIDQYYQERIRQAEGNEEMIAQLKIDKEKEVALATSKYSVEMMAADIELTRKRIENAKGYFKFEADRREALLKAEKKATQERLAELEKQHSIAPTKELSNEIEAARIEVEKFNEALARIPNERLAETSGYFAQVAGALGGLDGEIGSVFSSMSSSMSSVSESFSRDTSTMEGKAGAISAAVSGTVTLINMVISASQRRKAVEQEFYKNAIAFGHEYTLSLNEQLRLQSTSNAFIRDYAGEINDSFQALDMAMDKYYESIGKLNEGKAKIDLRNSVDWNATLKTTAVGAGIGAAIGSMILPGIGTAIGAAVGAIGGFLVGVFGTKKKSNVTDELLAIFPELIDAAGELNRELAQTLINTDQVEEKTKQLLQNALDWADACEAAREQIGAIVEELAGDLGNNLRNAIVGAWKAGEDASESMFEVAGASLENFITQLLYSALFSDIFDQFRDKLVDSLAPDGGDQDVLDDYDWLMRQMDEKDDLYVALLDKIKERAQQSGYAMFGTDPNATDETKRQGSSRGIQSMTQDTAEDINGRLTAILVYLDAAQLTVGGINRGLASGVSLLTEIRDNTAHCRRLERIDESILTLKNTVETINSRGVTIKN
jgi:hypothetical protein